MGPLWGKGLFQQESSEKVSLKRCNLNEKMWSHPVSASTKDKIPYIGFDSMEFIGDFRKSSFSGEVIWMPSEGGYGECRVRKWRQIADSSPLQI